MTYSPTIALFSLVKRETVKMFRSWAQTLLPTTITTALYFIIFGNLIGQRIGAIQSVSYSEYIAPGLIMLSVITNSYAQVSFGIYLPKFAGYIEEMLVSPMSDALIVTGFVCSGIIRGLICGFLVTSITMFFIPIGHSHLGVLTLITLLTTIMFSLTGFINGIYAESFDDIAIFPTFLLTPLTYLGGVFYSIHMLPSIWQTISHLNPVLYMVNTFRYGMIGISDIPVAKSLVTITIINIILFFLAVQSMSRSKAIRQ